MRTNLVFIWLLIAFFSISLVSANVQSFSTLRAGDSVNLLKSCTNSTYNNVTTITYPNSTYAFRGNAAMTENNDTYNYTFANTQAQGYYTVYGFCNENGLVSTWFYDFEVTYSGMKYDSAKAITSSIFFLVNLLIVLGLLLFRNGLPSENTKGEDGVVISISYLKYLRPIISGLVWIMLIFNLYMAANITTAYLPDALIGNYLMMLFRIMLGLTLPLLIIWLMYILQSLVLDKQLKTAMERGFQ